jgi:hypothetical protein
VVPCFVGDDGEAGFMEKDVLAFFGSWKNMFILGARHIFTLFLIHTNRLSETYYQMCIYKNMLYINVISNREQKTG